MKRVSMLIVAAFALLVLAGPSSASASNTVLCKSPHAFSKCPAGEVLPSGTFFSISSLDEEGGLDIHQNVQHFHCNKFGVGGSTTAESGGVLPLSGVAQGMGCTFNAGGSSVPCTVSFTNTKDTIWFFGSGIYWMKLGNSTERLTATFNCGGPGEEFGCTFKAPSASPPEITAFYNNEPWSEQEASMESQLSASGLICTGTYTASMQLGYARYPYYPASST